MTEERAFSLRESGIKEISICAHSFFRPNLKILGRRHDVADSYEAIVNCRNAAFDLLNIDMMYVLPRQGLNEWNHDLGLASEQDVDQITCYPLLITHYAPFYSFIKERKSS